MNRRDLIKTASLASLATAAITAASLLAVERILGEGIESFRDEVAIGAKFDWNIHQETGQRLPGLNSKPEHIKIVVKGMLKRLCTDRIDLLYQHRVDPKVPIEDVMGAIKDLITIGMIAFHTISKTNKVKENSGKHNNQKFIQKVKKFKTAILQGMAWLEMLVFADSINQNSVGSVTFEPDARTNWHLQPNRQIILALDGEGYYHEKGSPKKILHKGDVVKCPANLPHWHVASTDKKFQIAISSRQAGSTEWLQMMSTCLACKNKLIGF